MALETKQLVLIYAVVTQADQQRTSDIEKIRNEQSCVNYYLSDLPIFLHQQHQ